MKLRNLLILFVLIMGARAPIQAQEGLAIAEFFKPEFQEQVGVTAIDMMDANIKPFWSTMPVYRSLSITNKKLAQRVHDAVKKDGLKAKSRTVSMADGQISYGWYAVETGKRGHHGYIIYTAPNAETGSPAVLIYLESTYEPLAFKTHVLKKLPLNYD